MDLYTIANTKHKGIDEISISKDKGLTQIKSRFRDKRASLRKFKSKYKNFLIILIIFLFSFLALWLLDKLGVTKVNNIIVVEISGNEFNYIDANELKNKLEIKFSDTSYYKLEEEELKNFIISYTPYSKSISIEKLFPSSIKISIKEKIPILTIKSGDNCGVIDDIGACLEILSDNNNCASLAQFTSTSILEANELQLTFERNKQISFYDTEMILMTTKMLEQNGYTVESYEYLDETYIFYIESNKQIIFTSLEGFELQQKRMLVSLSEIGNRKLDFKVLDVRYDRPIITTK